ncbi:MAG: TRAP transporter substrate-binding protein [Desulfobacter sp.]
MVQKKGFAAILAICVLIAGTTSARAGKPITIKMASWDPPLVLDTEKTNGQFSSSNMKAQMFKKVVERDSGGRIRVVILPNGQVGGDKDAFEMLQAGALDMSAYPGCVMANFVPECYTYQIPYLFRDHTVANQVMNGHFGNELAGLVLERTGVRILRWGTETFMDYMTSGEPFKLPSDLKGKKIRTPPQSNYIAMTKLLGATPTPVPFSELYTALQQGVVDGSQSPMAVVEMFKLDQGLKFINHNKVSYLVGVVSASERFWKTLSGDDKKLVINAAYQASEFHRAIILYGSHLFGDSLARKGVTVYIPTATEKAAWKAAMHAPMITWTRKKIGDAWVDKILSAVADVEERIYR